MLGLLLKKWRSLFIKECTAPAAVRIRGCLQNSLSPGCRSRELAWVRSTQCLLQETVLRKVKSSSIDSLHFRFEKNRNKNEWTHPIDSLEKRGFEFLYKMYSSPKSPVLCNPMISWASVYRTTWLLRAWL